MVHDTADADPATLGDEGLQGFLDQTCRPNGPKVSWRGKFVNSYIRTWRACGKRERPTVKRRHPPPDSAESGQQV